ncbi:MAG: hypothetical protein PVJ39_09225 [Gammaproteobacteria bacterium]|jgi:hypothetical protein
MTISLAQLKKSTLYSEALGIDLSKNTDSELFKWLLASVLYGARISETIAEHTYQTFASYGLLTPEEILDAGWHFLVNPVMAEGGYVRYDGKTSTTVLRISDMLINEYDGSLLKLHNMAHDSRDLESKLDAFPGIGPVTVNIFLRELRPYWKHSDPELLPLVAEASQTLGLDLSAYNRKTVTFTRIEAGLIRMRKTIKRQLANSVE